jgi:hypothetical protein
MDAVVKEARASQVALSARFLGTRTGIIMAGAAIGAVAAVLVKLGNPPNMGVCVACFERDIAGALGLHRAAVVQYIRPEIIGLVLGALAAALSAGEFRPRSGAAPLVKFVLGFFAMVGALVFLGCPWRALLRLAGGDLNALLGLAGLAAGVWIGVLFLKAGFSLGRTQQTPAAAGLVMPALMLGLLVLAVAAPQLGDGGKSGPIFLSTEGPGAAHALLAVSLAAGLAIGFLAQRTRFCTVGAIRDVILIQDGHLMSGVLALLGAALAVNLALGLFHPGFAGQPIAHTNHLWNFTGMVLAGLSFTLAGGCPGRQLFLSGEGDGDAALFVLGMTFGAGFAHNLSLASSPKGVGAFGPAAVILGLVVVSIIGFTMRQRYAGGGSDV